MSINTKNLDLIIQIIVEHIKGEAEIDDWQQTRDDLMEVLRRISK